MTPTSRPSIAALKEVKFLNVFSESELDRLLYLGTGANYEAFTNVVIEGEPSWGIYLIMEGSVGIYKANKLTGQTYDVAQLHTGNFFGEMSLIDDNTRSATVRTLTYCTLFHISKDNFYTFVNQSSDLKLRFYENTVRNLVSRFRELDDNYVVSQYQLWKKVLEKGESRG